MLNKLLQEYKNRSNEDQRKVLSLFLSDNRIDVDALLSPFGITDRSFFEPHLNGEINLSSNHHAGYNSLLDSFRNELSGIPKWIVDKDQKAIVHNHYPSFTCELLNGDLSLYNQLSDITHAGKLLGGRVFYISQWIDNPLSVKEVFLEELLSECKKLVLDIFSVDSFEFSKPHNYTFLPFLNKEPLVSPQSMGFNDLTLLSTLGYTRFDKRSRDTYNNINYKKVKRNDVSPKKLFWELLTYQKVHASRALKYKEISNIEKFSDGSYVYSATFPRFIAKLNKSKNITANINDLEDIVLYNNYFHAIYDEELSRAHKELTLFIAKSYVESGDEAINIPLDIFTSKVFLNREELEAAIHRIIREPKRDIKGTIFDYSISENILKIKLLPAFFTQYYGKMLLSEYNLKKENSKRFLKPERSISLTLLVERVRKPTD